MKGWRSELETMATTNGWPMQVHQGEFITITVGRTDGTSGTTAPVTVLYRVKEARTDIGYVDLTPITMQQLSNEALYWPSKREINREASIKACLVLKRQHHRVPKTALVARTSFQQMARLPCYRGTRPR